MAFLRLRNKVALPREFKSVGFDSSHQHTLLYSDSTFYSWSHEDTYFEPRLLFCITDQQKFRSVDFAKISLDWQMIAVQVNLTKVVILDLSSPRRWTIQIKSPDDNVILKEGLIWSEHGGNSQDLIIVTNRGLELHKVSAVRGQCKLSRTITQTDVQYFWYEPNHRMILLASPQRIGRTEGEVFKMTGYFFRAEISDMPKLELPPPEKIPGFDLGPGILDSDIALVSLYGNLYCTVHYISNGQDMVTMYAVTKQSVARAHTLTMNTSSRIVRVSVIDNLLCCHAYSDRMCVIFDLKRPVSKASNANGGSANIDPICPATRIMYEVLSNGGEKKPVKRNSLKPSTNPAPASSDDSDWDAVGNSTHLLADSFDVGDAADDSALYVMSSLASALHGGGTSGDGSSQSSSSPVKQADDAISPTLDHVQYDDYVWQFLAPGWVWNKTNNSMWRMEICLAAISASIHDTRRALMFLAQRGQPFRAPRPVYAIQEHQDIEAKRLMLQRIAAALHDKLGMSWLEVLFKLIAVPYSNEIGRINQIPAQFISNELGEKNSASLSVVYPSFSTPLDSQSSSSSTQSGSSNTKGSSKSSATFSFAAYASTFSSSSSSSSSSAATTTSTGSKQSQATASSQVASSPTAPATSWDSEPMEPVHAMSLFLPNITAVGGRSRIRTRSTTSASTTTPGHSRGNEAIVQLPLSGRRDSFGTLIVSQAEMLSYVWLPIVLNQSMSLEYCRWALSTYITSLRGLQPQVLVHPTISILLLNLLVMDGKFVEVAHLLQLQFFPDSVEVAMTALELSDVVIEAGKAKARGSEARGSDLTSWDEIKLDAAVRVMQQVGLDMLWRLRERATVVRWLLGRGRVMEAITLCMKVRGQWKSGLSPGIISGIDFYLSGLRAVEMIGSEEDSDSDIDGDGDGDGGIEGGEGVQDTSAENSFAAGEVVDEDAPIEAPDRQDEEIDGEAGQGHAVDEGVDEEEEARQQQVEALRGMRVELLHTVFKFIRDWDHAVLTVADTSGSRSKLSVHAQFPDHLFHESQSQYFKELFGYK